MWEVAGQELSSDVGTSDESMMGRRGKGEDSDRGLEMTNGEQKAADSGI